MKVHEMLAIMERILESTKTAVLGTVEGPGNQPRVRWMTPTSIRGRNGFLYALTSPEYAWVRNLPENPRVEWMLQTVTLDEIMYLRGGLNVIENPALQAEVQEALGGHLTVFWKNIPDESNLVVLESAIEEIMHFKPLSGERSAVKLG